MRLSLAFLRRALALTAALALTPTSVHAVGRQGLLLGGRIGVGWIRCDEGCDTVAGLASIRLS